MTDQRRSTRPWRVGRYWVPSYSIWSDDPARWRTVERTEDGRYPVRFMTWAPVHIRPSRSLPHPPFNAPADPDLMPVAVGDHCEEVSGRWRVEVICLAPHGPEHYPGATSPNERVPGAMPELSSADPEPGSWAVVRDVLSGAERRALHEWTETEGAVRSLLDDGHGLQICKWNRLKKNGAGGRVRGSAQWPRGLPKIHDGYSRPPRYRHGTVPLERMLDAMNRAGLTDWQRDVLATRMGFYGSRPTQAEFAEALAEAGERQVSRQALAKVERKAAKKVRAVLDADGFERGMWRIDPEERDDRPEEANPPAWWRRLAGWWRLPSEGVASEITY